MSTVRFKLFLHFIDARLGYIQKCGWFSVNLPELTNNVSSILVPVTCIFYLKDVALHKWTHLYELNEVIQLEIKAGSKVKPKNLCGRTGRNWEFSLRASVFQTGKLARLSRAQTGPLSVRLLASDPSSHIVPTKSVNAQPTTVQFIKIKIVTEVKSSNHSTKLENQMLGAGTKVQQLCAFGRRHLSHWWWDNSRISGQIFVPSWIIRMFLLSSLRILDINEFQSRNHEPLLDVPTGFDQNIFSLAIEKLYGMVSPIHRCVQFFSSLLWETYQNRNDWRLGGGISRQHVVYTLLASCQLETRIKYLYQVSSFTTQQLYHWQ